MSQNVKTCSKCKKEKSKADFSSHKTTKDKLQPWCKSCRAEYTRMRYASNPYPSMLLDAPKLAEMKYLLRAAKNKPCTDCGNSYKYYVMQLDHLDPSAKKFSFDALVKKGDKELLLLEIAKCDVVCANCHMERTHGPLKRNGRKSNIRN